MTLQLIQCVDVRSWALLRWDALLSAKGDHGEQALGYVEEEVTSRLGGGWEFADTVSSRSVFVDSTPLHSKRKCDGDGGPADFKGGMRQRD